MKNRTQNFVDELVSKHKDTILSVVILGSREGEKDLAISDIDFLVLCKNKNDISFIFSTALKLQEENFDIRPTSINKFIQKFLLGSNSYSGIHLIILGRDEFDDNFRPTSLRLKFMTKLVGKNLFLYEMQQNHQLLCGKNFVDEIQIEQPGFSEKLACFLFPSFILLLLLPIFLFSRRTFKIWCFKVIKYHNISLSAFIKITKQNYVFNKTLFETAKFFRYRPDDYENNLVGLYFRIWGNIFGNLPFLFAKNRSSQ